MEDNFFDGEFLGTYSTEEEYRADQKAWNYSKIKDYLSMFPFMWKQKHIDGIDKFEMTLPMKIGSAADCKLFLPETYDDKFAINSAKTPTPNNLNFVDNLIKIVNRAGHLKEYMFEEAYNVSGIKSPLFPKFMSNFKDSDTEVYFSEKLRSIGKITVSFEEQERINRIHDNLKNSRNTRDILNLEGFNQLGIKFSYFGETFRCLFDRIQIDHKNKIIHPFDLKVTEKSVEDFKYDFIKSKYYVQQGIYETGVMLWAVSEYPGYRVSPFQFIASDMFGYMDPLIYNIKPKVGESYMHGFSVRDSEYKGVLSVIQDINWHIYNDIWSCRESSFNSKGKINIRL